MCESLGVGEFKSLGVEKFKGLRVQELKSLGVLVFVGLIGITNLAIAGGPDTLWTKTYGGTDDDVGYSVQECDEGGFIIAGGTVSFGAVGSDVWLIRTNSDGDTLWTKTYGGTSYDWGYSVQECAPTKSGQASGGFIIAGVTMSFGAGYEDIYLVRTDSEGDTLWTKTYGGTDWDGSYSVQECASGGFIIVGTTKSFGAGSRDVYLIRTDADGDTLWTKTYGGTSYDCGYSVQECASGGFIIAGRTNSFYVGSYDVYLVRTNAEGDTSWTRTYGGPGGEGRSVQECAEGGFIILSIHPVYLIRTNADGDTLWTKTYGGGSQDYGNSVQECASGGFIITGSSAGDVYLIRISETGVEEETGNRHKAIGISLEVYPNPSTTGVRVQWLGVSEREKVSLKIYDLSGKLVKQVLTAKSAGSDGQDVEINLEELANGIYFVNMEADEFKATRKLTILR